MVWLYLCEHFNVTINVRAEHKWWPSVFVCVRERLCWFSPSPCQCLTPWQLCLPQGAVSLNVDLKKQETTSNPTGAQQGLMPADCAMVFNFTHTCMPVRTPEPSSIDTIHHSDSWGQKRQKKQNKKNAGRQGESRPARTHLALLATHFTASAFPCWDDFRWYRVSVWMHFVFTCSCFVTRFKGDITSHVTQVICSRRKLLQKTVVEGG